MNDKQKEVRRQIDAIKPTIRKMAKANEGVGSRITIRCFKGPYMPRQSDFEGSDAEYNQLQLANEVFTDELQTKLKKLRLGKTNTPLRAWAGSDLHTNTGLPLVTVRDERGGPGDPYVAVVPSDRILAAAIIEELRITSPDKEVNEHTAFSNTTAFLEDIGHRSSTMSFVVSEKDETNRRERYETWAAQQEAKKEEELPI